MISPIIKTWLKQNHPHLQFVSYNYINETKLEIKCTYLDNSCTLHGYGNGKIVDQVLIVNDYELEI